MNGDDKPRTIRAVERASRIIQALEDEGQLTLTEISNRLDVSKSTVHTYLHTLSQEGFIAKHNDSYRLSLRYLSLSEQVKNRIDIYEAAQYEIDVLAEKTNERAQFAKLEENSVIYIYRSKSENAIPTTLSIGQYVYPHSTAAGKSMLAYLPDHRVDEIIEANGLPKQTENTITDVDEFKADLRRVRELGYAIGDGERLRGIRCIATPIQTDSGRVLGSIGVSGPSRRMSDERIESELRDLLLQSANVIEVNAKFS
ncbi:IclR family transcriptional regulator [Halobellus litoreus]|jgi:DNA-binding IclR family transcriptional regulator|uniref:IclR family transcriptional regulator n=1 Tax=Halobellus litoreus TaxID=755310 RepID=A0ABD6DT72_9EURY|nr:IclR family transcriptional regulator [Halobellus litoreus]